MRGRDKFGGWGLTYTHSYIKNDNYQGPGLHSELYSILCNNLNGKRIWERRDICICITELLSCTPAANITFLITCLFLLFSRSVMSSSLWPHGLQHARLPCPSLSPGVCPDSCSLSQWCYSAISSSITLFSSCPQSFPASGSFPMSQLFTSNGHSIGALASVLPMNIQGWRPLGLTIYSNIK